MHSLIQNRYYFLFFIIAFCTHVTTVTSDSLEAIFAQQEANLFEQQLQQLMATPIGSRATSPGPLAVLAHLAGDQLAVQELAVQLVGDNKDQSLSLPPLPDDFLRLPAASTTTTKVASQQANHSRKRKYSKNPPTRKRKAHTDQSLVSRSGTLEINETHKTFRCPLCNQLYQLEWAYEHCSKRHHFCIEKIPQELLVIHKAYTCTKALRNLGFFTQKNGIYTCSSPTCDQTYRNCNHMARHVNSEHRTHKQVMDNYKSYLKTNPLHNSDKD